jgi:hypothetical protein
MLQGVTSYRGIMQRGDIPGIFLAAAYFSGKI